MKLTATDDAFGIRGVTQQAFEQRARGGDDLGRIEFAKRRPETGDWLGKRKSLDLADAPIIKAQHRALNEGRAQVYADESHAARRRQT